MKKVSSLILVLTMLWSLCACNNNTTDNQVLNAASTSNPTSTITTDTFSKDASMTDAATTATTTTNSIHKHSYESKTIKPTCTEKGYTEYTCQCGDSYVSDYIKAKGHSFVQGICEICGDDAPDYDEPSPSITANKYRLELKEESDVVYITVSGDYTIEFDIADTSIVDCDWGDWDGYTIPLTISPISSGQTSVTISVEGYDASVTIKVSVEKSESALTIVGAGEEHTTYYPSTLYGNVHFLHSAEYEITYYSDGQICIDVNVVAETVEHNVVGSSYIGIAYELYNNNNVCVETGYVWIDARYTNRKYSQTIRFFVDAGDYTLIFDDMYV